MKTLRIDEVAIPFHWTAWEYPSEHSSGLIQRGVFAWIKKKPSRSASLWRLANPEKTRYFVVAISEHQLVIEAIERRMQKWGAEWYEIPEEDLIALVRRRAADALDALRSGRVSEEGTTTAERHFGGRWKLNRDGTLEPLDRPQG